MDSFWTVFLQGGLDCATLETLNGQMVGIAIELTRPSARAGESRRDLDVNLG